MQKNNSASHTARQVMYGTHAKVIMATNKRLSSEERNVESSNNVKRKDYSTYFNPIVSLNMLSNEQMNNVSTLQSIDILDSGASIHATP